MDYIQDNLDEINRKITAAAAKAGRKPAEITLVGVTKTIDAIRIKKMVDCGVRNLGENKVQEILEKHPLIKDVDWHMIGHLQTNKVKYIIDKVTMIHSIDSVKLAEEVSKRAVQIDKRIDILIEINIANESSKYGIQQEKAEEMALELSRLDGIRVCGLMCIAPFVENSELNRPYFKNMRQLFIDIKSKMHNNINMQHLSMGMTNDYDVAIEEGATIVRIGTGIFAERVYNL